MQVTINVTQAHIDAGVQGNCCGCPVALALAEQLPDGCPWEEEG
jgi:hypothetical protein